MTENKNYVFTHRNFPRELSERLSLFRDHKEDSIVFTRVGYLLSLFEIKIKQARSNQNKRVSISEEELVKVFDELAFVYCRHKKEDHFRYKAPIEYTKS